MIGPHYFYSSKLALVGQLATVNLLYCVCDKLESTKPLSIDQGWRSGSLKNLTNIRLVNYYLTNKICISYFCFCLDWDFVLEFSKKTSFIYRKLLVFTFKFHSFQHNQNTKMPLSYGKTFNSYNKLQKNVQIMHGPPQFHSLRNPILNEMTNTSVLKKSQAFTK